MLRASGTGRALLVNAWPRILAALALLCIWALCAIILDSKVLPSPQKVLVALWQELYAGELLFHLGKTMTRVAISFVLAMFVGVALGILMGSSKQWDRPLDVLVIAGLNIPALVTIILCYIWFGLTEIAAIIAVTVNKIPLVVVTIREGARAIDKQLMQVAEVYRLSRRDAFFAVYLPQLYPYLFASARNGLSLIWKIVLVVELLGRSDGIGFRLAGFFHFFDIENILAYTLAFILVIFVVEGLFFQPLAARLNRWRS
jgi:ABC-type nitrate/sulfonate/bicarbonate transport system permease component